MPFETPSTDCANCLEAGIALLTLATRLVYVNNRAKNVHVSGQVQARTAWPDHLTAINWVP